MSKDQTQVDPTEQAGADITPAIEMIDLCKNFGTFQAINHLSLTVQRGEIFGLLGPNGSGKTTTINMVSGLSVPTSGEVRVFGHDVRHNVRPIHQLLGAVPQETALYEELSAWANMDFHADLFGIPRKEKKERITRMLKLVQLEDRKDSRVGTFSGGMKRRLALGRALLHDPQLIYLDEPTLDVDVQARRAIWDYILSQREQGKTVLITTNYLEEAQILCDRLAIIDHGKLIAVDTPEHLKRTYGGSVIELETAGRSSALDQIRAIKGVEGVRQDGTHLTITTRGVSSIVPQVINILADFTQRVDAHMSSPVDVTLNNLNLDFTNDVRRSVPDTITQFYQAQGSASPLKVTVAEQDLRQQDVQLFQYSVVPAIAFLLTLSGLVASSISAAREWETRTVKELLLSPATTFAIITGKVLSGFVTTFLLGVLVLLLGAILGWTRPEGSPQMIERQRFQFIVPHGLARRRAF